MPCNSNFSEDEKELRICWSRVSLEGVAESDLSRVPKQETDSRRGVTDSFKDKRYFFVFFLSKNSPTNNHILFSTRKQESCLKPVRERNVVMRPSCLKDG